MKKISTLLWVLMALLALPKAAGAAEVSNTFDFENNPQNWPVGEGENIADGNLTAPLTVGEVSMTGINGSQPCRLMKPNDGVTALYVYATGGLKFNAAEGRAITKVEVTMKSGNFDFEATTGTLSGTSWTGNATEVTFNRTGSGNRQMLKIVVTTDAKNEQTVEPTAETFDVEAADIAAFNAVEDGKVVKLTLNNAQVNAVDSWSNVAYIEDGTGATTLSGATLSTGNILNGYVIGKKSSTPLDWANDSFGAETKITTEDPETFEATEGTPKVTATTPEAIIAATDGGNHGRMFSVEDVTITKVGSGYYIVLDPEDNSKRVRVRDNFSVLPLDFVWPETAKRITGLLTFNGFNWQLNPVTADAIVTNQPTSVTFDFTSETISDHIGTALGDATGNIYNETFTADNVTLQVTAGAAASKIYKDANRGQNLVTYMQYTTLTFKAPEGYAITQINFTPAGSSNMDKVTASSGSLTNMVWTGNAEGVRFAQGATTYLSNAIVTLAAKDAGTSALPAINYVECANIAEFNALEAGTYAKVTLTDAEVTGISADGYTTVFIQDATGGCWIQYTSQNAVLKEKTKLNGYIYTVMRATSGNNQMKEAEDTPESDITATDITDYTIVEGTLEEINVAANKNKVVKITGATLKKTSATAGTLTQGGATIDVNNGTETANQQLHKISEWTNGEETENVTITAILVGKSNTANQLLPISIETVTTGINDIKAAAQIENAVIYNLQGVRLSKLQKGICIVNGRKIAVK